MPPSFIHHPSSYRDPSGFLFDKDGVLYRQVNLCFKNDFDQFIDGGLYRHLVDKKLLISHQPVNQNLTGDKDWYQTLQPEPLFFISYPYEWCFDMLKDAALLTLEVAREAMDSGMMLKDASMYNVQWHNGRMIFIDTLSFEKYDEQRPWIAYRQFCEHFFCATGIDALSKRTSSKFSDELCRWYPFDSGKKDVAFQEQAQSAYLFAFTSPWLDGCKRQSKNADRKTVFSKQNEKPVTKP